MGLVKNFEEEINNSTRYWNNYIPYYIMEMREYDMGREKDGERYV